MKKVLSVILSVVLMLTALPLNAFNLIASAATSGYYTYIVTDDEATIIDVDTAISGDITIPSTLGGYDVTSIGEHAFEHCTGLTSITIPSSVTSIGDFAFYNCSGLTSITIPNSVTSIGTNAFYGCSGLAKVHISDLKAWCEIEFGSYNSNPLCYTNNLYLNNAVISGEIIIPEGATKIPDYTFCNCTGLTSITIPNSVTSIGNFAFSGCSNLNSVYITDLKAWCEIEFGSYNSNPLCYAKNLYLNNILVSGELTIPAGTTKIGDYAFYNCTGLTSITIPNSVISIGEYAFSSSYYLKKFYVAEDSNYYSAYDGVLYNKNKTLLIKFPAKNDITIFSIPSSVTSIGDYAFEDCAGLTSITIPSSVTSIGDYAFEHCTGLTSITIPNSVTSIGDSAFYWCTNLTNIIISDNLTSIGGNAFFNTGYWRNASNWDNNFLYISNYLIESKTSISGSYTVKEGTKCIAGGIFSDCTGLTSVTIPNSVISIGDYAFFGCRNLNSVYITDLKAWCEIEFEGYYANPLYYAKNLYFNNALVSSDLIIPEDTTKIGSYAFYNYTGLTSITIPNSVTSIGTNAFSGCSNINSVYITDLKAWCEIEFGSCNSNPLYYAKKLYLNNAVISGEIIIPEGATKIPDYTFYNCTGLTSITIPNSVTSIGDHAFLGCTKFADVWYCGDDKNNIIFGLNNDKVLNATWHYNTCSANHTYFASCDSTCNNCEFTRKVSVYHEYDSCCDADCNNCDHVREVGPHFIGEGPAHILSNSETNPFTLSNGWYTSTNKNHNSSSTVTLTAKHNCILVVKYKISSERIYDKLIISDNGTVLVTASGTISETSLVINLAKDDILTFTYSKDSSTSTGSDTASFRIESCSCLVNAEEIEPDCKTPVICSGCGIIVKPASTVHVYDNACDAQCNICEEMRDVPDHSYTLNGNHTCDICKHSKTPAKPNIENKTNSSVILVSTDGFEYSKDGVTWQTSNVFEGLLPNTTYTFYQRVKVSTTAMVSEVSEGVTVAFKSAQGAPYAPIISSFTDITVTLIPIANGEYSKDRGTTWQTSNVFTNLASGTKYTFYQRYAETDDYEASDISTGTSIITDKAEQTLVPNAPTLQSFTANSITLTPVDGCEYSKNGITWQSSNVFSGLACGTEYTFYQRYKETDTIYAGNSSVALVAKTDKGTQTAPSAPTLKSKTHNTVTLTAVSGYEYSRDGINWQRSNVFTGLEAKTNYMFYQRKAETETYYASAASAYLIAKTLDYLDILPIAPEVLSVTANRVVLASVEGYEYSIDGEIWQSSNIFENLAPNTAYTFYQRIMETNTHSASEISSHLIVTTIKNVADAPLAPELFEVTTTTVTLVAVEGYEYSLDGETWQNSNIFENLAPNTEYTFYQRKTETNTHYASEASTPLVVRTSKDYIPGDVNDSGAEPDLNDVVALAQIVAGWQGVAHNTEAIDVNRDGKVTLDDVVLLAQFVAGWSVTLS